MREPITGSGGPTGLDEHSPQTRTGERPEEVPYYERPEAQPIVPARRLTHSVRRGTHSSVRQTASAACDDRPCLLHMRTSGQSVAVARRGRFHLLGLTFENRLSPRLGGSPWIVTPRSLASTAARSPQPSNFPLTGRASPERRRHIRLKEFELLCGSARDVAKIDIAVCRDPDTM